MTRRTLGALLFVFLLLRPFIDGLTYPLAQYLFQAAGYCAGAVIAGLVLAGREKYRPTGLEVPAAAFLALAALSALLSASGFRAETTFLRWLHYFYLFFLVTWLNPGETGENRGLWLLVPATGLLSLVYFYSHFEFSLRPFFFLCLAATAFLFQRAVAGSRANPDRRTLVRLVLLTGAAVSLYGIHQFFWGFAATLAHLESAGLMSDIRPEMLARIESRRVFSTFVYPNIFAGFLISLVPLALALAGPAAAAGPRPAGRGRAAANRDTLPALASAALVVFALCLTRSGGGLLALAFTGVLWLTVRYSGASTARGAPVSRLKKAAPVLLGAGGFLGLFTALSLAGAVPLRNILSMRDRFFYWYSSLRIALERPLLGFGPGSFGVHYARYRLPAAMETQHSHSVFFEMLAETGFLGLAAFALFFALMLRLAWRSAENRLARGVFWATLALFLHSQVDFDFANPSLAVYLFILPALLLGGQTPAGARGVESGRTPRLTRIAAGIIIILSLWAGFRTAGLYRAERTYRLGLARLESGQADGLELLAAATRSRPANPAYYVGLADINFRQWRETGEPARLDLALAGYRRAVEAEPYSAPLRFRLGRAAEAMFELAPESRWRDLARASFAAAARLYPGNIEYAEKYEIYRTADPAPGQD